MRQGEGWDKTGTTLASVVSGMPHVACRMRLVALSASSPAMCSNVVTKARYAVSEKGIHEELDILNWNLI